MKDNWTDRIRETLSEHEVTPPEGLWESLAEKLPGLSVSATSSDSGPGIRTVPRNLPLRRLVTAAAVLALILCTWIISRFLTNDDDMSLDPVHPVATVTSSSSPSSGTSHLTSPHTERQGINTSNHSGYVTHPTPDHKTSHTSVVTENNTALNSGTHTESLSESPEEGDDTCDSIHSSRTLLRLTDDYVTYETSATRETTAGLHSYVSASRISIGLLTSYAGGYNPTAALPTQGGNASGDLDSNSPDPGQSISETHHDLPLHAGVTIQFPLSAHFALETGILYSYLSSHRRELSFDQSTTSRYRLHYLGIPLAVKYRIASWRALDLYVSAGGAVEKCVSGTMSTTVTTAGSRITTQGRCPEYPWQWSLSAGCGVQYRPIPSMGIYLEPGLSWYPASQTTMPIIYRDHPFEFSLTLGLRFLLSR